MVKKIFLILILGILLAGSVMAIETSYCCERTTTGAWCQNAPQDQCDSSYGKAPTSCESTSYCKLGICINTKEGKCMPNTPQRVCNDAGGVWDERDKADIPQCQLGCCLIGDQTAFVTQVRCKQLSSLYGLEINYRTDITNEITCIASAQPSVKGACVYGDKLERNCKMVTKKECQDLSGNTTEFHEGYLCSAEALNTICGPRGGTTCVEGKEDVYFMDTCGNVANVYDSSKLKNQDYWTYVQDSDCGNGEGNKGSGTCGDCDYYSGSTCKKGNANYGDYVCKDLKCEYQGETYQHGETWCAYDRENSATNSPGGSNARLICYNGEVLVEDCEAYRQETCIQDTVGDFRSAACRVNKWQDCYSQTTEDDCENIDKRDCKWVEGYSITDKEGKYTFTQTSAFNAFGSAAAVSGNSEYSCVPRYTPGFNFWENETDATSVCSLANDICVVEYYTPMGDAAIGLISGKPSTWAVAGDAECMAKCRENCLLDDPTHLLCDNPCAAQCLEQSCVDEHGDLRNDWLESRQDVCTSLGDCGSKNNYIGAKGYFDWDDAIAREDATANKSSSSSGGLGGIFGGLFGGG